MSSSLSPQEPAQHPPQPTKTEGQQRVKRIETNASIIWPGPGRSFEIYFETDDYVQYYFFLHELCEEPDGQCFKLRMMTTELCRSKDEAEEALDRELEDIVRQKLAAEWRWG
jgi:hypothetical protein